MENTPLVSIAVCTYNGERFLSKQIDSIINQRYTNLEIVISDDCSRDSTRQLLQAYQEKDARIKLYLNKQNLGYTKNFEHALNLCTGKYIAFADQDDIWTPDKIDTMVAEIADNIMLYHNSDYIDEHDNRIGNTTIADNTRLYDGDSCLPFILANCVHGHTALFSSKLKSYLSPFDKRFSHDWWLAYVAFNVGKVRYLDKVLVHYRQHPESVTDSLKLKNNNNFVQEPVKGLKRIPLNLSQLKHCAQFKHNRNDALINKAHDLFANLEAGNERIRSFLFLVKHYDLIFYLGYKPRKFFSKLNMARKICFE